MRLNLPLQLIVILAVVPQLFGNYYAFLKVSNVTGGSQDTNHIGWSDVQDFSFGGVQFNGVSKNWGNLIITKAIDQASPTFALDSASAMLLPTVMLDLTTTNSTVMECFRLTLSNAVITSVENNYDMTSSLSETLGLNFGQLSWNIAQFNTQNGLPNNYASTLFTNSGNPINGQSPIFLSGNFTNAGVFVANGIRNTNLIQLTWNAIAGKNYCIYAVSRLNQPFLAVGQISATFTGQTNASCSESVDRFCEERLIK